MARRLRVLSLGGGTQSSALLMMSIMGVLPKLDAAVFADTQWEPDAVYATVSWLATQAGIAGIPVVVVSKGNLRQHTIEGFVRGSKLEGQRYATLPLYTKQPDGSLGAIRRQCTREYKVEVIETWIRRELLGLRPRQRVPSGVVVEKWFGISSDEASRTRSSPTKWQEYAYPLCQLGPEDTRLPRTFNRGSTINWLNQKCPGCRFVRSACKGCPFHSNREWREIKADLASWEDVVEVDERIRHADGMRGEVFLHRSCVPLKDADLGRDIDQEPNLFNQECMGLCGV